MNLLKFIENKEELANSTQNLNKNLNHTFKECYSFCFTPVYTSENPYKLKIDSVLDFLHDELNTGHWSEISVNTRQAFTAVSFIKANIILKNSNTETEETLTEALKTIDLGLLLGAPLDENPTLLTQSAQFLSQQLNRLQPQQTLQNELPNLKKRKFEDYSDDYAKLKGKEIPTLQCPSIEVFNKSHFMPQTPVKLQDCMTHWPATTKWLDANYLLQIAGNRTIPVEIGSHYADENWTQKLMSLKEFISNHYLENSSDKIGYLAQHNLFDQILELKDDIYTPEYCALSRDYGKSCDPDINAWFGPKDTVSPLHFDPKDNLLTQVYGMKQVLLYPPSDSEYLYPHDDRLLFNTARVNPLQANSDEEYPMFKYATMYKCLLKAGEMLYIPLKWWHHVKALDKSFSVSFWWQ